MFGVFRSVARRDTRTERQRRSATPESGKSSLDDERRRHESMGRLYFADTHKCRGVRNHGRQRAPFSAPQEYRLEFTDAGVTWTAQNLRIADELGIRRDAGATRDVGGRQGPALRRPGGGGLIRYRRSDPNNAALPRLWRTRVVPPPPPRCRARSLHSPAAINEPSPRLLSGYREGSRKERRPR